MSHKPVRQLVTEMGEALTTLTPCLMMSPLSVAQFLPAEIEAFDLVVFDEASQITVPDAIGAIARGKRCIVVGDPQQMPPTRFFERGGEDDENDEVQDLESILDEALAARVPLRELGWTVRTQIGVSKFRIDLGVVHPDMPGGFLAGIECDGATYHSSPSARDRDRIRHIILEQLGWRLFRVWSTDFFLDPETSINALNEQLNALLEEDRRLVEVVGDETLTDSDFPSSENDDEIDQVLIESVDQPKIALQKSELFEVEKQLSADRQNEHLGEEILAAPEDGAGSEQVASAPPLSSGNDQAIGLPNAERFYDADYGSHLKTMAATIIDQEGPITFKRLSDRIARLHGFQRTGRQISSTVWGVCQRLRQCIPSPDGHKIFWPDGIEPKEEIQFRGLTIDGERREWREVPHPEKLWLVRKIVGDGNPDPARAAADAIGSSRVTGQFRKEIARLQHFD